MFSSAQDAVVASGDTYRLVAHGREGHVGIVGIYDLLVRWVGLPNGCLSRYLVWRVGHGGGCRVLREDGLLRADRLWLCVSGISQLLRHPCGIVSSEPDPR